MATEDLVYDSDAHVYMSKMTSEALDLTKDSYLQPSPVAQSSQEPPTLPPLQPSAASIAPGSTPIPKTICL